MFSPGGETNDTINSSRPKTATKTIACHNRVAPKKATTAAAVVAFLGATLLWQAIVFVAVFGLLLLIVSLVSPPGENTHETVYGIDRVVGKEAVVLVAIDPKVAQGRVRVEREIWPADSESGQPIPDGSTVQVLAIRGERVLVRPLPGDAGQF